MKRIYGFRWRQTSCAGRVPDCNVAIRFVMHHFWLMLWHIVPTMWMLERSGPIRNRIGILTLSRFGWWAYSHEKYYGYTQQEWERYQ